MQKPRNTLHILLACSDAVKMIQKRSQVYVNPIAPAKIGLDLTHTL